MRFQDFWECGGSNTDILPSSHAGEFVIHAAKHDIAARLAPSPPRPIKQDSISVTPNFQLVNLRLSGQYFH
jgi:hypothetical protein